MTAPDSLTFNLLSVCRPIVVLDKTNEHGVVYVLQELDSQMCTGIRLVGRAHIHKGNAHYSLCSLCR